MLAYRLTGRCRPEGEELLEILRSDAFRKELRHFSGNDYRDLGKIVAEV